MNTESGIVRLAGGGSPSHAVGLLIVAAALSLCGCRQDMHDQPKYEPLESSRLFDDGRASRPLLPGTIARGHLHEDDVFFSGRSAAGFVESPPVAMDRALLERGRQRYDIFCSPCHDRVGRGEGMIVQRGYKRPPSLHTDRLRELPSGYLYQVIGNGFGQMPPYRAQVPPQDRWAIVAYMRALQRSQNAGITDVPVSERQKLEEQDG